MTSLLFNGKQNKIFEKQFEDFNEDLKIWKIINVYVPILIILIPTFLYGFLPAEKANLSNLILNGSFSLLGINILFTMSILLINSIRLKDQKFEREIINLRTRLIIYLAAFLIIGTILYILQIIFIIDSDQKIWTLLFGFILTLIFSIGIGKRIYVIKDELIGASISEDINSTVDDLKNSLNDL